jgi:hypothetical protein
MMAGKEYLCAIWQFCLKLVVESMAQRQRDLLFDEDEDSELLDQDPEVMPGFYQGDMAGVYYNEDVRYNGITTFFKFN